MIYTFDISSELGKTLDKLAKKDAMLAIAVRKKIHQIVTCDDSEIKHFKNLKGKMSHLRRVHVRSFILTFRISKDKIIFETLKHHDNAYN